MPNHAKHIKQLLVRKLGTPQVRKNPGAWRTHSTTVTEPVTTSANSCSSSSSSTTTTTTTKRPRGRPRKSPPPIPPSPASPAHSSLASFLAYARQTSLSPRSPVYVGTYYEYLTQDTLRSLGFTLHRVAGPSDLGIDLVGTWRPPPLRCSSNTTTPPPSGEEASGFRVLVQCKAETPRPRHVRELQGARSGAPVGWRGPGTVLVLVAKGQATRGVREAVARGDGAVVYVDLRAAPRGGDVARLDDDDDVGGACGGGGGDGGAGGAGGGGGGGWVRQVVWNGRAGERLVGVGVARWVDGGGREEVRLTWEGRVWVPPGVGGKGEEAGGKG